VDDTEDDPSVEDTMEDEFGEDADEDASVDDTVEVRGKDEFVEDRELETLSWRQEKVKLSLIQCAPHPQSPQIEPL